MAVIYTLSKREVALRMESFDSEKEFTVHVYRELMNISRHLRRKVFSVLKTKGITGSQFAVLEAIPEKGIPLSAIAKIIRREPSNITGIVDRLEKSGWIQRGRDPEDRRVIRVYLNEKGKQLLEEIKIIHPDIIHHQLSVLTLDEKKKLLEIITKIKQHQQ